MTTLFLLLLLAPGSCKQDPSATRIPSSAVHEQPFSSSEFAPRDNSIWHNLVSACDFADNFTAEFWGDKGRLNFPQAEAWGWRPACEDWFFVFLARPCFPIGS